MKKKHITYLLLISLGLLMSSVSSVLVAGESDYDCYDSIEDELAEYELVIIDANYFDHDGDGFEDDITSSIVISFPERPVSGLIFTIFVYTVRLPTGEEYTFTLRTIFRLTSEICCFKIISTDTATEAGWYAIDLETTLIGFGPPKLLATTIDFDPPTGSGGGFPKAVIAC